MIIGVGNDLIEIARVIKACNREAFLKKYYTYDEIKLICTNRNIAADNFAVKEAVSKVMGTGFRGIAPIDIEVLRDEKGKPYVNLYGRALEYAEAIGITDIHVSISNTKKYSSAFVVGEKI